MCTAPRDDRTAEEPVSLVYSCARVMATPSKSWPSAWQFSRYVRCVVERTTLRGPKGASSSSEYAGHGPRNCTGRPVRLVRVAVYRPSTAAGIAATALFDKLVGVPRGLRVVACHRCASPPELPRCSAVPVRAMRISSRATDHNRAVRPPTGPAWCDSDLSGRIHRHG